MQSCWTVITSFVCDSDPIVAKCSGGNNGSDPILKIFHLYQCRINFKSAVRGPQAAGPGIAPIPAERLPRGTQKVLVTFKLV